MARPITLGDFRRLAKEYDLHRPPREAWQLHGTRQERWDAIAANERPGSLIAWLLNACDGAEPGCVRTIPLGDHSVKPVHYARAQNWESPRPGYNYEEQRKNCGRYSSRCTWNRYEYTQTIESWGAVVGGCLYYRVDAGEHTERGILRPWRGWHWEIDENGIVLLDSQCNRDYHPTATDLLNHSSTRSLARLARDNDATRRREAKAARHKRGVIRRAQATGLSVCLRDSICAGNCSAGTTAWAERHGLDPATHVRPDRLLALANGDADRVALVVQVALRRHLREMGAGVCQLADHR